MRVPRYKVVLDRLAREIRSGVWPPGARLPTHRELAAQEGIALVTASRVYAELEAMGLVSGEQGRGTYVRDTALFAGHGVEQAAIADDVADLNFNYPSVPGQAELLRRALRELSTSGDIAALLRYQPHGGRAQDRASVARHLRRRGLDIDGERIMLVNGAQHGLAVTVMAALRAGDVVAVDALTYPGFKVLAQSLGLELAPVPGSEHGPDLDHFEQLCARRRVRAAYLMPTMHNPLGWVMDAPSRMRLVETARRHGVLIIEDASYAFLAKDPPPPVAALAPDVTVYVSGLSKSVATGLRFGFVAAPSEPAPSRLALSDLASSDLAPAIERAIRATTWNTPAVITAMASRWLDDGTVDRLEAEKREDAGARQRIAAEVLEGCRYVSHPSSYFIWLPLPEDARADRIAASLIRKRISVATAEPFATTTHVPQALRLALGSTGIAELGETLQRVREAVIEDARM
ncbi:PLP-dependent aminotransferase family protein [Streptomyces phaeofaciens JCM 4814]|uniref:GntR family transcriptional regulator n=2 Tax=Streptomyces phaeofaciens TaxID=68254 RepID=A0A918M075_9ACTN|nr:GntR family transcriptional regulator [Streptomyces phaeofaciens]